MAWKQLTYDDMRLYLAKDELDRLQQNSIDSNLSTVVNDTLDLVSDAYRGAWRSKGYDIDSRDHYTCSSYKPFILAYARWTLWNRFPDAGNYALTETRKDEWTVAKDLLKNPYLGVDPISSDDPQYNPDPIAALSSDGAISIPWLRFMPLPGECGFPSTYPPNHILKG